MRTITAFALAVGLSFAPFVASAQSLSGLSDNEGCPTADSQGIVVSRHLTAGKREVEGFRFTDQYGTSYINVSLPEAMSKAKKAALHARLLAIIQPGAKLKVNVQGCGAAARIEVLTSLSVVEG